MVNVSDYPPGLTPLTNMHVRRILLFGCDHTVIV